ncbi:MAG TPA: peptide chain release factor N(5)-glutamine methyltransferase [Acidimicrobiales bacterium]|nr:peptide chain release factor N(5)-glutamine methyltransferase [Acidimicrobiales bacterium]
MTRVDGASAGAVVAPLVVASTPTRGELVAELTAVVGAPHEARFIVDEALGLGLTLGHPNPPTTPLDDAVVSAARAMASRRAAGEPLQYVFGHWPFRRLNLFVDPRVLIPRPETEQVVEVALAEARLLAASAADAGDRVGRGPKLVVVDAGTGSGAIALSLATELGGGLVAEVWATDASTDALAVAESNLEVVRRSLPAAAAGLPPTTLAHGNWLEPLPARLRGGVDVVVSNPPYVAEAEYEELSDEVRLEPRGALVAGAASDGTAGPADVETVLREAPPWLRDPGAVVIEIAPHQAEAAAALASELGYAETRVDQDLAGRPRALVARSGD